MSYGNLSIKWYFFTVYCCVLIGCKCYICDFHKLQAWERKLKSKELSANKEVVLPLLRNVGEALTVDAYEEAVNNLKEHEAWRGNERLQSWFSRVWLNHCEVSAVQGGIGQPIWLLCTRPMIPVFTHMNVFYIHVCEVITFEMNTTKSEIYILFGVFSRQFTRHNIYEKCTT